MTAVTQAQILAAFPNLTPATRDDGAIATALSVNRVKTVSPTNIGIGHVLGALGPMAGAAFLDELNAGAQSSSLIKYGLQMLNAENFDIGNALCIAQINAFVTSTPALLTAPQAQALINLAVVPDPVSPQDVAAALEGWGD